ncbi:sulfotransferase family 2 domain-containing protein [Waterburya agarophytonicola K14]|uniref:Sulfotransferase family 2 domain-containing protein n=1 Tax=Waterburya agarophytonicola KI4 TaxID=2874699 RepID=A0A964FHJ3_9CYAN|nr:sulfotransferase family 2 domain-containing protein [Waterburya agarophytonicola]MCC0179216.1 sulfotransferase family 2 domain-containing protein [Waterburya agarophytonicola KI4]
MIVADRKKIAYIHIYKTGGSSITKLLMPHISENCRSKNARSHGPHWRRTWHIDTRMHSKFADALSSVDRCNIDLDEYFKFTIVRNPYSWILSVWNNFYQSPTGNSPNTLVNNLKFQFGKLTSKKLFTAQYFYEMYPDGSFENFVLFIDRMVSENPKLARTIWGCSDQYSFIDNDRNIEFDFIGKFENLEEDLKTIFKRVEGKDLESVPRETHGSDRNKQKRKNYLTYYNDKSIEIVNRIFARDFKAFDYQPISNASKIDVLTE